ncbi:MAG: hypothetical protein C4348_01190 [Patescibacteria group bacterium]
MAKFSLIEKRFYFYLISFLLMIFGIVNFFIFKPPFGIDLVGGEFLEVKTSLSPEEILKDVNFEVRFIKSEDSIIFKSRNDLNQVWQKILELDKNAIRLSYEKISPSLSKELRNKSFLFSILVILAITFYIVFAFRQLKRHFNIFVISFVVILTLFHDILGTIAFYSLFLKIYNYEIDIKFITALLIILGYSVHDTIVVFDRLRENISKTGKITKEIFDLSIKETMRRSIFTSLTAILSILPLAFMIKILSPFLFSLIFGIIVGTYSSIFFASPMLYEFVKKK